MSIRRRFVVGASILPLVAVALASVEGTAVNPTLLFGVVLAAATLCVVAAIGLGIVAHRNEQAELGFVSAFFFAASLLPLVHGITTPGVLYSANAATMTSIFLAVPVGLIGMAPSLARTTAFGRSMSRRWRGWVAGHALATSAVAVTLLAAPQLRLHPEPGSGLAWITAAAIFAATVAVGQRHAWLADVAGRLGPLTVGVGLVLVGLSGFAFIDTTPFSLWFWAVHAIDITGVFLATVGGAVVYYRNGPVDHIVRPVLAVDPHAALELGLSPVIHRFVGDLRRKDEITRDHVVRTADLAVDVATELGLPARQVRRAGLAALLHDIGKLEIPDEILTKPGRLTDGEFSVMRSHAEIGGTMLADTSELSDLADAVRGHHERFDGTGYPDRLAADRIPIEARIVAACDSYDAMANTRHYRTGMDQAKVRSILSEHSGAQWDPTVIDAVITVIDRQAPGQETRLKRVGDAPATTADREFGCSCLPEDVLASS